MLVIEIEWEIKLHTFLFPYEAYSLTGIINISGIDFNKFTFATMITIYYKCVFLGGLIDYSQPN